MFVSLFVHHNAFVCCKPLLENVILEYSPLLNQALPVPCQLKTSTAQHILNRLCLWISASLAAKCQSILGVYWFNFHDFLSSGRCMPLHCGRRAGKKTRIKISTCWIKPNISSQTLSVNVVLTLKFIPSNTAQGWMRNVPLKKSLICREIGNPSHLNVPPGRISGPRQFQYRRTSTKCNNSVPVGDQRTEDKVPRSYD